MFEEDMYILGLVDLATGIRLIHLLGGRSIRIAV